MAHQHPPQMTEPASQPRGQDLGVVESSVRAAVGRGYEVGVCVCVYVCELMFSLYNTGYFSICLLKRFTGRPRWPNHRTAVCAEFCGLWSLQKALCFPSA